MEDQNSDNEIITDIKNGRSEAYSNLIEKYQNALVNSIFRITGNRETAEEIAQDAFYKVYTKINIYNPEFKFYTFLYKIAVNTAMDYLRNRKNTFWNSIFSIFENENNYSEIPEDKKNYDEILIENEEKNEITSAIEKLSPRRKTAVILSVYNKFSYKKIGEIMQCSEKAVERLIAEARQDLKKILLLKQRRR